MLFSWGKQMKPYICLAPMAGYTDSAFRQIIKEIAPETIVFSEMVSSDGLKYNSRTNKNLLKFKETERPFIVQLFGKVPENFATAAKMVEEFGADGIDINMGCPAHKVVKSNHGAALIKTPKIAQEIVQATVSSTTLPVSVKTRLGWADDSSLIDFCKGIEKAGANLLTIHGRTYTEGFTGTANWDPIYKLKSELKIPVIGNGDIKSVKDAKEKIQNLDGIIVGRATFGNPWLMQELTQYFYHNHTLKPIAKMTPEEFRQNWLKKNKPLLLKHCQFAIDTKGERIGMNEMRKHLALAVKGLTNATELRKELVLVSKLEEVEKIFEKI